MEAELLYAVINQCGGSFLVSYCHLSTVQDLEFLRVIEGIFTILTWFGIFFQCCFRDLSYAADDIRNLRGQCERPF